MANKIGRPAATEVEKIRKQIMRLSNDELALLVRDIDIIVECRAEIEAETEEPNEK